MKKNYLWCRILASTKFRLLLSPSHSWFRYNRQLVGLIVSNATHTRSHVTHTAADRIQRRAVNGLATFRSAEAYPDSLNIATSWASFKPAPRWLCGVSHNSGSATLTGPQSPQISRTKWRSGRPVVVHVPTEHSGPFIALRRSYTQTHVKSQTSFRPIGLRQFIPGDMS